MIEKILEDALFAALAAVGFAAISRPPRRAYLYCALIAAVGHSLRYILMSPWGAGMHIIGSTLAASFVVGTMAVLFSPVARTPAETCLFPALLPMIPGIYAYKTFAGVALGVLHQQDQAVFDYYMFQFMSNGLMCTGLLLCMVVGATLPIFIFKKVSFRATRSVG